MKKFCLVLLVLLVSNIVQAQSPVTIYKDQPKIDRLVGAMYQGFAVASALWVLNINDKEVRVIMARALLTCGAAIHVKLNPNPVGIKTASQAGSAFMKYHKLMLGEVEKKPPLVKCCYIIGMKEIELWNMSEMCNCFPKDHKITGSEISNASEVVKVISNMLRIIGASEKVVKSFQEVRAIVLNAKTAGDTVKLKDKLLAFDEQFSDMLAPSITTAKQ